MATPLSAQYRIDFPIVIDGVTHHTRHYLKATTGSGPSGYDGVLRDGTVGVDVTDLAQAYYTAWKPFYAPATSTFGNPTLEQFSSGAWLPVAALTTSVVGTGGSPYVPAAQMTVSLRDTAFHKVRAIALETTETAGQKQVAPGTGAFGTLLAWYTGPIALTHTNGWNWVVGRSNLYVGSGVSIVTDLNDKLRRRRGIA